MQNTPFAAQQQQVNKFLEATRILGANMDKDQGTTRVLFDTTGPVVTGTFRNYNFFNQVSSKNWPETNVDQNRFQPGEGMVIKEIGFADIGGNLGSGQLMLTSAMLSVINVYIGNNRVIKDLPLSAFTTPISLNPLNSMGALVPIVQDDFGFITSIRLRTNIVIPPQVQYRIDLQLAGQYSADDELNLKCYVKGYGKLFNPNSNY